MRVLVTGDRNWDRADVMARILGKIHARRPITLLIHGDCRGADRMAAEIARAELGLAADEVRAFPANWDRYGPAAGPIRNIEMIAEGKPEFAVAFHPDLRRSKGTLDCVRKLLSHRIPTGWTDGGPLRMLAWESFEPRSSLYRADGTPEHRWAQPAFPAWEEPVQP